MPTSKSADPGSDPSPDVPDQVSDPGSDRGADAGRDAVPDQVPDTGPDPVRSPVARPVARLYPPAPAASIQGTLALDLVPRHDPPEPTRVRATPGADVVGVDLRTRRRFEQWARTYTQVACDVVAGLRPVSQLLRWSTAEVYADLGRRAHLVARAGRHRPGGRTGAAVRPRVAAVRPSFLDAETVEVAVRVQHGPRSRALAARFEVRQQHWTCVALDFA